MPKTTRRKPSSVAAADPNKVPSTAREIPVFCPLFPTTRVASVGKTVVKRIWYDDTGEERNAFIVHPRINAEMDEADLQAVAGGGEFYVGIHKNDGTGHLINHRKFEIEGDPKGMDEEEEEEDRESEKPTVIQVPGADPIVMPGGLTGPEQAAFMAREQQVRASQKELDHARKAASEGGSGIAGVLGPIFGMQTAAAQNSTQLMMAMMTRGDGNSAALQQTINIMQDAANKSAAREAALITDYGAKLSAIMTAHANDIAAMRAENSAATASMREELSKALDEGRRLAGLMESRIATAVLEEKQKAATMHAVMQAQINQRDENAIAIAKRHAADAAAIKQSSETVELARLFAPQLDKAFSAIGSLGGKGGLPKEMQEAVDVLKEMAPIVRKLKSSGLLGPDEPAPAPAPVHSPAPAPAMPPRSEPRADALPARTRSVVPRADALPAVTPAVTPAMAAVPAPESLPETDDAETDEPGSLDALDGVDDSEPAEPPDPADTASVPAMETMDDSDDPAEPPPVTLPAAPPVPRPEMPT